VILVAPENLEGHKMLGERLKEVKANKKFSVKVVGGEVAEDLFNGSRIGE